MSSLPARPSLCNPVEPNHCTPRMLDEVAAQSSPVAPLHADRAARRVKRRTKSALMLSELPASLQGTLPISPLPSTMASQNFPGPAPRSSSDEADLLDMDAAVAIIGSYGTIQQ